MSDFGSELTRLMEARGVGVRELARLVPCNPGHISNLRSGKTSPSPEMAAVLDKVLSADGSLAGRASRLDRAIGPEAAGVAGDEIAAFELARRAEASDVGHSVLEQLELAFDDLATAYPGTRPQTCSAGSAFTLDMCGTFWRSVPLSPSAAVFS
jgi:transcriptional regulator with XRE-family HTH domain